MTPKKNALQIKATGKSTRKIYAYKIPPDWAPKHKDYIKIGDTTQDDVEIRINQQIKTPNMPHETKWWAKAIYSDNRGFFRDTDFHLYLDKLGYERMPRAEGGNDDGEWFRISSEDSKALFEEFRKNKGILQTSGVKGYLLREEQEEAVSKTYDYFKTHENGEFLWNAKPRFGKTLTTYDLCMRIKADKGGNPCNVLIVTNRPAIANSWYDDFETYIGTDNFFFVSEVDALKKKNHVATKKEFKLHNSKGTDSCIEFVSLPDLKGSKYFAPDKDQDKLKEVRDMEWDLLVIDEAHEGVDTNKTDVAFSQIKRKYTLHLSGTPFKALANNKFDNDAIFNWTYTDEQTKKANWDSTHDSSNPYKDMPQLNLFAYQMSEIIKEKIEQGIELDGKTESYAHDLREFFSTRKFANKTKFVHDAEVDKFLDALTTQEKFPFSTPELRDELRHSFWLLDNVDSAKALAKKLKNHPIFKDYEVVIAAGNGKLSEEEETANAYDKVCKAIITSKSGKTITLSVGQLTTGVTVPEWTAVLMLSNIRTPARYIQAAFRCQNPWYYLQDGELHFKENAYVFDFDPLRSFDIYEKFANGLSSEKNDNIDNSEQSIRKMLNLFPVIGEDIDGKMIELDAEKVLAIRQQMISQRAATVVDDGFKAGFLFRDTANLPPEIKKIVLEMPGSGSKELNKSKASSSRITISLFENAYKKVFGNKIYVTESEAEAKRDEVIQNLEQELGISLNKNELELIRGLLASKIKNSPSDVQENGNSSKTDPQNETAAAQSEEAGQTEDSEKNDDDTRDRLQRFGRMIPALLMAYGDENTTLENLDTIIPENVFFDIAGIKLETFRILRDGYDYTDEETGEKKHRPSDLFDSAMINYSIKEFISRKNRLANYFDDSIEDCIFNYIPPISANIIFTPKKVAIKMVDMLEEENPGCFDDPDKTFIDLYMKSGLYIAEIVKRLYNSGGIKAKYPDDNERLQHIFAKQVYGLASSELLYKIAVNYILGFDGGDTVTKHNFRQFDALPYAKDGLDKKLTELFGE